MALPTASDNVFPKVILSEQAEPATPSSGQAKLFLDTSDGLLKWKDDGGAVYTVGAAPTVIEDYPATSTDTSKVLAPDGAGGVEFRAEAGGGGGGGLVLLEQHTASSSASLDFTSCISSTYDEYLFEMIDIIPATDGADFRLAGSTDGGATWVGGTSYRYNVIGSWVTGGGLWQAGNGSAASISLTGYGSGLPNTASKGGYRGSLRLFNPLGTTAGKVVRYNSLAHMSDDNLGDFDGTGEIQTTSAINAIQFIMSSGNIASGTIRAYGIAKS